MQAPNLILSVEVLDWFRRCGGNEIVLCAGARNLALVAVAAGAGGARIWHHPEERSAGFFALGRSRATGRPVAVVVTSGTAVAELLPSAVEATYQQIPLVFLTADRPRRYRGTGAPQAIEQPGIFGPHADFLGEREAGETPNRSLPAVRPLEGPVHLNLCFDEPILDFPDPAAGDEGELFLNLDFRSGEKPSKRALPVPIWDGFGQEGRLLVMVGGLLDEEVEPVAGFLRALGAPVWVEATSGLWGHPAITEIWIRNPGKLPKPGPTHVLRLGGVPCDRLWRDLENQPTVAVRSWSAQGWSGLARMNESAKVGLDRIGREKVSPQRYWAGPEAREPISSVFATGSENWFMAELSRRIPGDSLVFLGNSLPIREWQAAADWRPRPVIRANRGANGIDGEVSTFLGLAADRPTASWGIFGDLTAIYDLAGPWVLGQMPAPDLRIVVINNGGGAIFRSLPAMSRAGERIRKITCNDHMLDFSGWAQLWGLGYLRIDADTEWPEVIPNGPVLLELIPKSEQTEKGK